MKRMLSDRHAIFTVENVVTRDQCNDLIARAEGIGFTAAPVTTAFGFVMMPEVRDNTRVMIDDPERAEMLWSRLSAFLPRKHNGWTIAGLNERLRFYRYEPGQRFAWHRDGAFVRNPRERSHLTLLLYLNDGFEGGATELDVEEPLAVRPPPGAALLFAHHLRHQGARVTRGRKYILRSDVMYRKELR